MVNLKVGGIYVLQTIIVLYNFQVNIKLLQSLKKRYPIPAI